MSTHREKNLYRGRIIRLNRRIIRPTDIRVPDKEYPEFIIAENISHDHV